MRLISTISAFLLFATTSFGQETLQAIQVPYDQTDDEVIVLQNDSFKDSGGQAYLQLGFIKGEKAGVHLQVPDKINLFKIDYFRVLMGSANVDAEPKNAQVFFQMGITKNPEAGIATQIENAAQITPGPYWNDIPAQGYQGQLGCATGGEYVAAALEFVHDGAPSVYRDLDGLSNVTLNSLYGIPGGWKYSVQFGLRGDWILRVVGHEATPDEC